jgi:Uma2 family endonuclease
MVIRRPAPPEELPRSRYHGVRMPLEAFEALPEEKPSLEYWDGVVLQKAVGKWRHGKCQLEIAAALAAFARRSGGAAATEIHVYFDGRGFRVPDAAYWAPDKPTGTDDRALPPTLAVEVRSKGESMDGQRQKCREMRANGVDVCWLIDPESCTAEVFDGEADGVELSADGRLESPHLPGFSLALRDLFAALDH